MLYARELIDLLGAFPGRDFRIRYICRYIANGREQSPKQLRAMQRAVQRALGAMAKHGTVEITYPDLDRGAPCLYRWKSATRSSCDARQHLRHSSPG